MTTRNPTNMINVFKPSCLIKSFIGIIPYSYIIRFPLDSYGRNSISHAYTRIMQATTGLMPRDTAICANGIDSPPSIARGVMKKLAIIPNSIKEMHTTSTLFPERNGTAIFVRKSPNPTEAHTTPIPRQAATRKIMEKLILPIISLSPISMPGMNIRYGIVINP